MDARKANQRASGPIGPSASTRSITIEIVAARAGVTPRRVHYLVREGIVESFEGPDQTPRFDETAIVRITQCERLINDLGVNLAGAEVILNMRDRMVSLLEELERTRRSR